MSDGRREKKEGGEGVDVRRGGGMPVMLVGVKRPVW